MAATVFYLKYIIVGRMLDSTGREVSLVRFCMPDRLASEASAEPGPDGKAAAYL